MTQLYDNMAPDNAEIEMQKHFPEFDFNKLEFGIWIYEIQFAKYPNLKEKVKLQILIRKSCEFTRNFIYEKFLKIEDEFIWRKFKIRIKKEAKCYALTYALTNYQTKYKSICDWLQAILPVFKNCKDFEIKIRDQIILALAGSDFGRKLLYEYIIGIENYDILSNNLYLLSQKESRYLINEKKNQQKIQNKFSLLCN